MSSGRGLTALQQVRGEGGGKEDPTRSRDCPASNLSLPILPRPAGSRSGLSGSYAAMDKHRRHSEAEFIGFDESEREGGRGKEEMGWEREGVWGRKDGVTGAVRRQTQRWKGRGTHANFRLESRDLAPFLPFPCVAGYDVVIRHS